MLPRIKSNGRWRRSQSIYLLRRSRRTHRAEKNAIASSPNSRTGIFGMNLNKVNGSPLPYWAVFIVLGIVLFLTGMHVVFGGWFPWHRRKEGRTDAQLANSIATRIFDRATRPLKNSMRSFRSSRKGEIEMELESVLVSRNTHPTEVHPRR